MSDTVLPEVIETTVVGEDSNKLLVVAKGDNTTQVVMHKKITQSRLNSFDLVSENGDILSLRIRDGRPRFVIEYKLPVGKSKADIDYIEREGILPFNFYDFSVFVTNASLVLEDKIASFGVTCLYDMDKDGKRTPEKINKGKITLRKNAELNAYEAVVTNYYLEEGHKNREVVFLLAPGEWHKWEIGGKVVPRYFFSKVFSIKYFERLDKCLDALAKENKYTYITNFPADKLTNQALQVTNQN